MIYESQRDAYLKFIVDESYNEEMMSKYIQEAIEWTSGNMNKQRLLALQEDVKDTIKEKFTRLWEKIKEIVRKIIGTISNFATSNQGFLEKNKDIITGKVLKYTDSITMYPYTEGIKRIGNTKIAEYNYDRVNKSIDPENFSSSVVKGYFGYGFIESDLDGLEDKFIDYFRGGQEKDFKPQEINMSDLYDYCINYKTKIVDVLDKDQKLLDKCNQDIINNLSKVKINPQSESAFGSLFEEEMPYSLFFEQYMIIDEDGNDNNQQQQQQQQQSSSNQSEERTSDNTNNKPVQKSSDHIKNSSMNKEEIKHGTQEELNKDNKSSEDLQKLEKKCTAWFNCASAVLQAKTKVCKEIYDTYFGIIKKHVKSYLGQAKDDNEGNSAKQNVSDYANGLSDKGKEALNYQKGITDVQIRYKNGNQGQTDPDNYVIKINTTDDQGNNQVITQDVGSVYKGDKGTPLTAGSVRVGKDPKNNLWKLYRTYDNNGKKETRIIYIDPRKAQCNAADFIDGNTVGLNK